MPMWMLYESSLPPITSCGTWEGADCPMNNPFQSDLCGHRHARSLFPPLLLVVYMPCQPAIVLPQPICVLGPTSLLRVLEPQELILAPVRNSPNELDPVLPRSLIRPVGVLSYAVAELTKKPSDGHALRLGRQGILDISYRDRARGLREIKLAARG